MKFKIIFTVILLIPMYSLLLYTMRSEIKQTYLKYKEKHALKKGIKK